jgi:hypothetical protein
MDFSRGVMITGDRTREVLAMVVKLAGFAGFRNSMIFPIDLRFAHKQNSFNSKIGFINKINSAIFLLLIIFLATQ